MDHAFAGYREPLVTPSLSHARFTLAPSRTRRDRNTWVNVGDCPDEKQAVGVKIGVRFYRHLAQASSQLRLRCRY